MKEAILHGECLIVKGVEIPANAVKRVIKDKMVKIADSETTGNHHVIDVVKGVEFFDTPDGRSFMRNSVPTAVRCVHTDRHDTIDLAPGNYEIGVQQEYDYFAEALRNVRD